MSKFYKEKHTKEEITFIKKVAKDHKVSVSFRLPNFYSFTKEKKVQCKAVCVPFKSKIFLDLKKIETTQELLIVFFHELQHCINYKEKKFFNFHKQPKNKEDLLKKISLTLRAEQYTDYRAKKLLNSYLPMVPYLFSYKNKAVIEAVRFENSVSKILIKISKLKKRY